MHSSQWLHIDKYTKWLAKPVKHIFSLPRNPYIDYSSYIVLVLLLCFRVESFQIVDCQCCEELRKDQKGVKECHEVRGPCPSRRCFKTGISSRHCWLFWVGLPRFWCRPFPNTKYRGAQLKLVFRQLWAPRNSIGQYLGPFNLLLGEGGEGITFGPWWPHL